MKLLNFFYSYYLFSVSKVVLLGLMSAYLDALAISSLLNSEDFIKVGIYILISALLRLYFIYSQAKLGSLITTDLGINIIKDYTNEKLSSIENNKIELSGLVLLKAVNFNNYVIRPVLSLFINGISVLLLIFPIFYNYINYSFYALVPVILLYLFYFLWFKSFLKNLSMGLSKDQDYSGFFVSLIQDKNIGKSESSIISNLSFFSYKSLQDRTALIYFLSQSPRSWFELALIILAIFAYLFLGDINVNFAVIGGLSYTFYRVMTPLNSVIQAAVSMKSFKDSSLEVMEYALKKDYKKNYLANSKNSLIKIKLDNKFLESLKKNNKKFNLFKNAVEDIQKQFKGKILITFQNNE